MSEKSEQFLKSQVLTRTANEQDVNFIFNSWLKSYQSSVSAKLLSPTIYFQFHHKVIEQLLQRCAVVVACQQQDPTQVYGYLVYEVVDDVPVIHYAYVKHAFRQMGIYSLLLAATTLSSRNQAFYTHETHTALKLIRAKSLPMVYNPYLAYGVK